MFIIWTIDKNKKIIHKAGKRPMAAASVNKQFNEKLNKFDNFQNIMPPYKHLNPTLINY